MMKLVAAVLVLGGSFLTACHNSRSLDGLDGSTGPGDLDSGRVGRPNPPVDSTVPPIIFEDPGCDSGVPPEYQTECDPYADDSCGPGLGCYAWAVPPETQCGQEIFVSACIAEGPGQQGDSCLGQTDCAGGHGCVVTGAGTQCAANCNLTGGEPQCPRGFVCRGTDVPGYGVCF